MTPRPYDGQATIGRLLWISILAGCVLQIALAIGPDPGIGSRASDIGALQPDAASILHVFTSNLETLAICVGGSLLVGWAVLRGPTHLPRVRMALLVSIVGAAAFLWFVTGVDGIASTLGVPRADMAVRLPHGFLEWPAFILPWTAVTYTLRKMPDDRRLDVRLVAVATCWSVVLLLAAATIEATVTPGLLTAS